MSEWPEVPLGDLLTEPMRNGIHKGPRWQGRGTPLVKMGEVYTSEYIGDAERDLLDLTTAEQSRLSVRDGDLLFCRTSLVAEGVGKCALVKGLTREACFASNLIRARIDDRIADVRFVHWVFRSPLGVDLRRSIARGTSVTTITGPDLATLRIPLPPLAEQQAIAGVLGALDDKIDSNRRASSLLESLMEAEFDKAVADAPSVTYGEALLVQTGVPFSGESFAEQGTGRPLIRIRDLKTLAPQVWTTEQRPDEIVVTQGDVLVGMDAEFRSTLWLGEKGVLNQRVCRFAPLPHVGTAFALLAIRTDLAFCERAKSGTTVIHLNKSDIECFRVPSLTEKEHRDLKDVTQPLVQRIVSLGNESRLLQGLRDALLPELLSGRLRVRDAEQVLEGSV